jgi:hypothetical protein
MSNSPQCSPDLDDRVRRPRATVPAAPRLVSQRNVTALFGLSPRKYLDLVRGDPRVICHGEDRLVRPEVVEEKLLGQARRSGGADSGQGVAEVLKAVGRELGP